MPSNSTQADRERLDAAALALISAFQAALDLPPWEDDKSASSAVDNAYFALCRIAAELELPRPPSNDAGDHRVWARLFRRWWEEAQGKTDARVPRTGSARRKLGRSKKTEKDSVTKVVAALIEHHRYDKGSVMNYEPATNRGLAKIADLSSNALTRFLRDQFPSESEPFKKYQVACRNRTIGDLLALWNRELASLVASLRDEEEEEATRTRGQHRGGRTPGNHRDEDD
jgi:hypothetical protein